MNTNTVQGINNGMKYLFHEIAFNGYCVGLENLIHTKL